MVSIVMNDFYKSYSEEELNMINKIIEETVKKVNDNNILEVANSLSKQEYSKYPEIQYYRVNLLIRAGKINKAYKIATNYPKFSPLYTIRKELETKIKEYEPKRIELVKSSIEKFRTLCPEVRKDASEEVVRDLSYEDAVELNQMLDDILLMNDREKIISYTKDSNSNRYFYMQYLRVKMLIQTGKEIKAKKILDSTPTKFLFEPLRNGIIKEVKDNKLPTKPIVEPKVETKVEEKQVEQIEEVKEEVQEPVVEQPKDDAMETLNNNICILITKLYFDNITLQDIEEYTSNTLFNSSEGISKLRDFKKTVMTLAYYHKYNKKMAEKVVKESINYYKSQNEFKRVKTLNRIKEEINNKSKKLFNLELYRDILSTHILFSQGDIYGKKEEIKVEKPKEIKEVIQKVEIVEEKKTVNKPKYIISTGQKQSKLSINPSAIKETKNPQLQDKPKERTIKEELSDAINVVELELYKQMNDPDKRKTAIKAWDILQNMVSKPISNKEALNKVISFLSRVDKTLIPSYKEGLDISVDYKKYQK